MAHLNRQASVKVFFFNGSVMALFLLIYILSPPLLPALFKDVLIQPLLGIWKGTPEAAVLGKKREVKTPIRKLATLAAVLERLLWSTPQRPYSLAMFSLSAWLLESPIYGSLEWEPRTLETPSTSWGDLYLHERKLQASCNPGGEFQWVMWFGHTTHIPQSFLPPPTPRKAVHFTQGKKKNDLSVLQKEGKIRQLRLTGRLLNGVPGCRNEKPVLVWTLKWWETAVPSDTSKMRVNVSNGHFLQLWLCFIKIHLFYLFIRDDQ